MDDKDKMTLQHIKFDVDLHYNNPKESQDEVTWQSSQSTGWILDSLVCSPIKIQAKNRRTVSSQRWTDLNETLFK